MPRDGSNVYAAPAGTLATTDTVIASAKYNAFVTDIIADANLARPVVVGGTGAASAADARTNLGLVIGVDVHPYNANLEAISAVAGTPNTVQYFDAGGLAAITGLTSAGRALNSAATAAAQRTILGAQASLGFTPVQQGGGTDMDSASQVRIGWDSVSGSGLRAEINGFVGGQIIRRVTSGLTGGPDEIIATGSAPMFACRSWVNFNGTGVVAIRGSGNVSSVTDNGVGDFTVNFTAGMTDVNYSVVGMARRDSANEPGAVVPITYSTGSVRIVTGNGSFTLSDCNFVNLAIFR